MNEAMYQSGYPGLPIDNYNPMFTNFNQENRVGLAKELDPQNTMIDVVFTLRGQLKNPMTNQYDIKFKRMLNEDGVAIFINQVKGAANAITTYSNFRADEKLIYKLMNKWIADLVYIFYYDRKKFVYEGTERCLIDDESSVSIIINMATGLMLASFFKAFGAGDRSAVTRSVSEMIQKAIRDYQGEGVDGGGGRLKRMFKRMTPGF